MTGKVDRFVTYALLQATISCDHISMVIDDILAEPLDKQTLGQRHTDGGRNALSERASRHLDALRMTIFWVTGRLGAKLAETLQFLVVASGFTNADIEYRSPIADADKLQPVTATASMGPVLADLVESFNANVDKVNSRMYTFLDYAVIGTR